jgi:flagellar basal body-associated protein FliL
MPRLTRFQALIILITVAIIVLIAAIVFLFLSYQNKIAKEKKVNADIQTVQQLASQNAWTQLEPSKLKSENFAPEAVTLAETLARQNAPQVEIARQKTEIVAMIMQEFEDTTVFISDPNVRIVTAAEKIVALGDKIIPATVDMAKSQDPFLRHYAYTILNTYAKKSDSNKAKALPYLIDGMNDPVPDLKIRAAHFVLKMGEKQAVPVFISSLNNMTDYLSSDPPVYIGAYCNLVLRDVFPVDFGKDPAKWLAWWNENEQNLKWDNTKLIFYQ